MRRTLMTAALLALAAGSGAANAAAKAACDRACLNALVDSYLAALVAHDPGKVPFAANVKFVENITPMKPGEGL